jgi:hypothetical protein
MPFYLSVGVRCTAVIAARLYDVMLTTLRADQQPREEVLWLPTGRVTTRRSTLLFPPLLGGLPHEKSDDPWYDAGWRHGAGIRALRTRKPRK